MSSVEETNKNDQSYANYSVQLEGRINETDLYQQAKALFVSVQDGEVKAAAPEEKATPYSSDQSVDEDNEIPF